MRPQPPASTINERGRQQHTGQQDKSLTSFGDPRNAAAENGHSPVHTSLHQPWLTSHTDRRERKGQEVGEGVGEGWSPEESAGRTDSPPLHDAQVHLRAVHALLDSLPPEFRTAQRRPSSPRTTEVLSFPPALPPTTIVGPSLIKEPLIRDDTSGVSGSGQPSSDSEAAAIEAGADGGDSSGPSSMPEISRLLSSLDRVDQRLSSLGSGDASQQIAGCESGNGGSRGWDDSSLTPVDCVASTRDESLEGYVFGDEVTALHQQRSVDGMVHLAASTIQRAWRVLSMKLRATAAARAEQKAVVRRRRRREEAAVRIQIAHRRAQARHRARAAVEERTRWQVQHRRRAAACATLEKAWKAFELQRTTRRELVEARARALVTEAAARRAEESRRAATIIQALVRGGAARATARRLRLFRAGSDVGDETHSGGGGGGNSEEACSRAASGLSHGDGSRTTTMTPAYDAATGKSSLPMTMSSAYVNPTRSSLAPRRLPPATPSTFYNQLSQDPRRRCPLPDTHVAVGTSSSSVPVLDTHNLKVSWVADQGVKATDAAAKGATSHLSGRFGPPPGGQGGLGTMRQPRFADLETARIARIMKGNLQHWAGVRSGGEGYYSSSDDVDM